MNEEDELRALKLQFAEEEDGHDCTVDADYSDREPVKSHDTVRLPFMEHGFEIDPMTPEQLAKAKVLLPQINSLIQEIFPDFEGRNLVFRIMKSDKRI